MLEAPLMTALIALIDERIKIANGTPMQGVANGTPMQGVAAAAQSPDPFGGLTAAPATAPVEVTPMMIQEIIIPLLSNEGAKARLQGVMQELGIPELPAARPDQLPTLYTRFKAIAAEVNGAAATPATSGGVNLI